MTLYITSMNKSIGVLLAREVEGIGHLVYYLSRSFRGAEMNYSSLERHYVKLIFEPHHYLLAYYSL